MIEPSGTMSGGGKSCLRGRMGRRVATDTSGGEMSAKDIVKMEQRLQQLNEECAELRRNKQNVEDSLQELNRSSREGNTNLQKWKIEIKVRFVSQFSSVQFVNNSLIRKFQALDEQQKTLKQQIANQEKKVMDSLADQKQVKAMESAVEEKRKAYETASQAAAKVETKVQKVHGKIMELTEGKMNKAREKLDAVVSQISKVSRARCRFPVLTFTTLINDR